MWDKKTGKPVYNAIVWQDRRQEEFCKKLRKQNKDTMIFNKTGLLENRTEVENEIMKMYNTEKAE